jgi:hypothetical protein
LITQQEEIIKQLQSRLNLTEGTSIKVSYFRTQALEVSENLEISQHDLFMKVEAIQKYYQVVELSLKDIYIKERESFLAQVKFQEAFLLVPKDDVSDVHHLSLSEQIRGDIVLKVSETNLTESKRLSRDVIEACIEALTSLDKGLIYFEGNVISKSLG